MKKIISIIVLLLNFTLFAETKNFYVTRHGQRGSGKYRLVFKNITEDTLMPKGIQEAKELGKFLKGQNFQGTVYVSPYYRTLETATYALNEMGIDKMILEPRFQEVNGVKDASGKIHISDKCLTKKEIKKNFPKAIVPKDMSFPWRIDNERQNQTDSRVKEMVDDLLKESGDVFIVGHAGILKSFCRDMESRGANFPKRNHLNCCLYRFAIDTDTGKVEDCEDYTHLYLPEELWTDNLSKAIPYGKINKKH